MQTRNEVRTIGRCIYCGSTEQPLTNEHIIPQGLGGREFLGAASCPDCCLLTGRFEQDVQRDMVWPLRIELGMRGTRRRRPPDAIEIEAFSERYEMVKTSVAPNAVPASAALPHFPPPGYLAGRDPNEIIDPPYSEIHTFGNVLRIIRAVRSGVYGVSRVIPAFSFMRMLAKIGHCEAIARIGPDLDSLLCNVIRGMGQNCSHFVGSFADTAAAQDDGVSHWIQLEAVDFQGRKLLVASIRLFAIAAGPMYQVVIGQFPSDRSWPDKFALRSVRGGSKPPGPILSFRRKLDPPVPDQT